MKKAESKFLFVADDPCLDFLNTQMILKGEPIDTLETFEDLVEWVRESPIEVNVDLNSKKLNREGEQALNEAKQFRKVLRDTVINLIHQKRVPDSTLEAINHYMRLRDSHPVLLRQKNRFLKKSDDKIQSPNDLLAVIAETAANLFSTADFSLIHKCENEKCILFFYDTTRNHARRWCSMTVCGNRQKAATHYEKVRKKKTSSAG
jgi:predicted RNA-binding Zn ribbon-like protein